MRSQTCSGKGILSLTHNSGHYDAMLNTDYFDVDFNQRIGVKLIDI